MRILHLFSNWKWTGPAEPAVNLAAGLAKCGHVVDWVNGQAPSGATNFVAEQAKARGFEPVLGFRLRKHRRPLDNLADVRALRRFLDEVEVDLVHTHLDNDHLIAARARRKVGRPVHLVRSEYGGDPSDLRFLPRLLTATDGLLCVSEAVRSRVLEMGRIDATRVFHVEGAVDLKRFSPSPEAVSEQDLPTRTAGDPLVVGVVARMQTHRRFELLLEAFRRVASERSDVIFRIIGRGTNQQKVAIDPVKEMGLTDRVEFLGYLTGEDYESALRGFSLLVYLVPGSDGSCRTVREAMAVGLPIVASKRGILSELVRDGVEGLSVEENVSELANALLRLAEDESFRSQLSRRAFEAAKSRFGLENQARRVETIYRKVLKGNPTPWG